MSLTGLIADHPGLLLLLPLLVLLETATELLLNWGENWSPPREKDPVLQRGSDYQSRALTVIGLVIATISILISFGGGLKEAKITVFALGQSAGLLLLSHQLENLILHKTVAERLQVKTFEFGAFSLFLGLILVFQNRGIPYTEIFELVLLIALAIHYLAWAIYCNGLYRRQNEAPHQA